MGKKYACTNLTIALGTYTKVRTWVKAQLDTTSYYSRTAGLRILIYTCHFLGSTARTKRGRCIVILAMMTRFGWTDRERYRRRASLQRVKPTTFPFKLFKLHPRFDSPGLSEGKRVKEVCTVSRCFSLTGMAFTFESLCLKGCTLPWRHN
jgi:hypothetical protein